MAKYIITSIPQTKKLNTYAGGGMIEPIMDNNGEPRCPDGYEYNSDTGYCEKFGDKCPPGYEKDPDTGRCRSLSYKSKPGILDKNKKAIDRSKLERKYAEWPQDLNLTRTEFDDEYGDIYIEPAGSYTIYSDNNEYLTSVPFYPDLNYKVEVDSNKKEGYDKSSNTYYVNSKDSHQYEKYRQWQILKDEEKNNLDKIQKAGLKTKIGETQTYNPDSEYKFSTFSGSIADQDPNSDFTKRMSKEINAFKKLYEDPEYIPDNIKNQSFNDYQNKRKKGNIEAKPCPECSLYHGSTYDIGDDYIRENMNLSSVTKEYPDVIFKKDADGYEDAQNVDWEKEYNFTDPDLNRAIPKFDNPKLELEKPGLEDYDFPKGEYYPDKKKYLDWQLNQRYNTQPLVKVREKNIIRKEDPLLRFVTGYDRAKKNSRLYKEHKEWGDRFKKELGKLNDNPEDVKFPSFRGIPVASWKDLKDRRQYKKEYKDYIKNELPSLIERNKEAKAAYEQELIELDLLRRAEEDKRNAVNADPNSVIKWKYGGILGQYAGGGDPCPNGKIWNPYTKKCISKKSMTLMEQFNFAKEALKPVVAAGSKVYDSWIKEQKALADKEKAAAAVAQTFSEVEIIGKRPMPTIHGEIPKKLFTSSDFPINSKYQEQDWRKQAMMPDSFSENIGEFIDFTGYTSWDDAYRAYTEWSESGKKLPTLGQGADMFGAVPALGKFGKLKYLVPGEGLVKSAYKYFPWQQVVNAFDTAEDIETDNTNKKMKGGSLDTYAGGGEYKCAYDEKWDKRQQKCVKIVQNLSEATIYDPEGKKIQTTLFQKLKDAKDAYQNFTKQHRGKKYRLNDADSASSIEQLRKGIQLYKDEYAKEQEQTRAELKKLENLKSKAALKGNTDIQNLNLKDLNTVKGKMKIEDAIRNSDLDSGTIAALYKGFGLDQVDQNVKRGYGPDAAYSAKEAEAAAMKDVPQFVNMVSNVATAIPLLGGAGALGSAGAAIYQNPIVQAGLTGYGVYDAATNTIPEAYRNFSEGNYLKGFGNAGLAALDLMPGAIFGDFKRAGKYLNKGAKTYLNRAPGPMMLLNNPGGSKNELTKEIANVNYFDQLLNTYDDKALSITNKKYYKELINAVKGQGGKATQAQFNELQRLKNANFDFGKRGFNKESLIQVEPKSPSESKAKRKLSQKIEDLDSLLGEGLGYLFNNKNTQRKIDEGNAWLKNWIEHPETQAKIDTDFQYVRDRAINNPSPWGMLDAHDLAYMQAKSFEPNSKMFPLKKQFRDYKNNKSPIHSSNFGVSYMHGQDPYVRYGVNNGTYTPFERYGSWISRSPFTKDKVSTTIHEGVHDWVSDYALKNSGQKSFIESNYTKEQLDNLRQWEDLISKGIKPETVMGRKNVYKAYMSDPTEVHARIMELRKHFNLTPKSTKEITTEEAEKILKAIKKSKTPIDRNFADVVNNDPNKLKNLFKELWAAPIATAGAVGTAAMMANPFEGSDGLPQQKKGGVANNYIELELPKNQIQDYINQGYIVEEVD